VPWWRLPAERLRLRRVSGEQPRQYPPLA
jgi:hypothetical protein